MSNFFIFGLLATLDVFFTYFILKNYKKLKPRAKIGDFEVNQMVVWFWKKFGFRNGTVVSYFFTMIGIFFLSLITTFLGENLLYFFIGAYSVIFLIHLSNYSFVKEKLETREYKR